MGLGAAFRCPVRGNTIILTLVNPPMSILVKVIEPGPNRTVGPKNPWTVQIHGLFKVRNRSMRKKHGTVRTAVRPSGSVNRDRFGWFGLFQPLNDVVQLLFFFFFPPKRRRSETAPAFFFFFPSYTASFCHLSKSLFWFSETLSHFSTLTRLCPLSKITLKSSHSQILAPLHCRSSVSSSLSHRTLQLSLSPASPLQRSLDRSSLVAVAAQPRYDYVVLVGCDLWFMIA